MWPTTPRRWWKPPSPSPTSPSSTTRLSTPSRTSSRRSRRQRTPIPWTRNSSIPWRRTSTLRSRSPPITSNNWTKSPTRLLLCSRTSPRRTTSAPTLPRSSSRFATRWLPLPPSRSPLSSPGTPKRRSTTRLRLLSRRSLPPSSRLWTRPSPPRTSSSRRLRTSPPPPPAPADRRHRLVCRLHRRQPRRNRRRAQ